MANVYSFLGDYKGSFQKASWQAYCDLSGSMQYVGRLEPEIEVNMNEEYTEFWANDTGIAYLFLITPTKVNPMVTVKFKQVGDPNIIPLVFNMQKDDSAATVTRSYLGTQVPDLTYAHWMFASKALDGRNIRLYLRQGAVISSGAWTSGAAAALASVPATIRCVPDATIADTTRNLLYFEIDKQSFS